MATVNVDPFVKKVIAYAIDFESTAALTYIFTAVPWLNSPVARWIAQILVKWIVTKANNTPEKILFYLNTKMVAADQAKDLEQAIDNKNSLPPGATDEDIRKAEQAQDDAFDELFNLGNSRLPKKSP